MGLHLHSSKGVEVVAVFVLPYHGGGDPSSFPHSPPLSLDCSLSLCSSKFDVQMARYFIECWA